MEFPFLLALKDPLFHHIFHGGVKSKESLFEGQGLIL